MHEGHEKLNEEFNDRTMSIKTDWEQFEKFIT